ncbi:MAG: hypothetical protein ABIL09_13800 [Gemmatimonadota bacterium]
MPPKTMRLSTMVALGLDERWRAEPGSATELQNWRRERRGGWESIGGYAPAHEQETPGVPFYSASSVIQSMHWFSRHQGAQQFLLYEDGSNMRVFVGSGTTGWETIDTGRYQNDSPWQRTQYAVWGGWCYFINGVDEPKRYDGRRVIRPGFERPPPAPVAYGPDEGLSVSTTVNDLGLGVAGDPLNDGSLDRDEANNSYVYAQTFVNELGVESPLSEPSNEVSWISDSTDFPRSHLIPAVEISQGGNNVVAINLYRSKNYAGQSEGTGVIFYFVKQFRANISDTVLDSLPDQKLGFQYSASDFGPWPRGAKYIAFFKGICFLAGMPEYPDRVVYSRAGQPENIPAGNYLSVGDNDGGEIRGLYASTNSMVVFKQRAIYLVKGDPVNGFFTDTLTEDYGCSAPNSIKEVPGVGLVFASEEGVFALRGGLQEGAVDTGLVDLSATIQDTWRDVNIHALMSAQGELYHHDREYWLQVPQMGETKPTLLLVYHYDIGQWSTRPGLPINCMAETRDHRGYLMLGSHDTTNAPGIHSWSRGWLGYNSASVDMLYESAWLDFGKLWETVAVDAVLLYVVGYDGTLTLDYYVDRRVDAVRATASLESPDARVATESDESHQYITWGSGTWGDGNVAKQWRPVVVRFDVDTLQGHVREFKFRLTTSTRVQIIGWDVEIRADKPRDIRPINIAISPQV